MTVALLLTALSLPVAEEPKRLTVTVTETAGLRRFGYPVEAVLPLPADQAGHCRLLADGKPVVAQFQPGPDGKDVMLDFNLNLGPMESRKLIVEYGPGLTRGSDPVKGLRLEPADGVFRLHHTANQVYELPTDLRGLIRTVRDGRGDYLRSRSTGLVLRTKDEKAHPLGGDGTAAKVTRSGPMAVSIRYRCVTDLDGYKLASTVDVTSQSSKSWVRVDWTLDDTRGDVAGLGLDLNLSVDGSPTLIDFGAGSTVYTTVRGGQRARLWSERRTPTKRAPFHFWEVSAGEGEDLASLAVCVEDPSKDLFGKRPDRPTDRSPFAEGWAHVMDRTRCTALAIADFSDPVASEITVAADGRIIGWRHFRSPPTSRPEPGRKRLTFWLHFVPMPVQVGAVTSPQSMLAPLKVEVKEN